MRKNIFLLLIFFLAAIGTKTYSQAENYIFSYYIQVQATSSVPDHIDEGTLTDEDRAELEEYEEESYYCEENDNLEFWDMGHFIFNSDRDTRNLFILDFFDVRVVSEQDSIVVATYNENEEGDSVVFIFNLKELTLEQQYFFLLEDNPFFNEDGNNFWGIYRINFIRTGGQIIPEKETYIEYDLLESEIPYAVTEVSSYLYYKIVDGNDTIVEVGDEELFNDCMEDTDITEAKGQNAEMNIYPNPAKEQITVNLSAFMNENVNIEIFNTVGSIVFQGQAQGEQTKLDIQFLPAGFYIIRCANEGKMISKRFIKQ